ncbi:ureidoglycolate dehydrogenase (NAD(+))-like isoform X2 [Aethina tumida]|nr:ureidoglycolate dehydrogenase (NAD(+))-like isoform X2 [Aethina tumida]
MTKAGCSDENAEELATVLTMADSYGVYSNGINRLEQIFNEVKNGTCNGKGEPCVVGETKTTALINGDNAPGPTIANFTMRKAISMAKDTGIGIASAYDCHHYEFGRKYVLDAIRNNCIAFAFMNSAPVMMPANAKEVVLGTNPLTVGAPGQCDDKFLFNCKCTKVSIEEVDYLKKTQGCVPDTWALDNALKPLADPYQIVDCPRLLPVGGTHKSPSFKASGLAMAIEILTGVLSGGAFDTEHRQHGDCSCKPNLSMTFMVINAPCFTSNYKYRMQTFMNSLLDVEPIDPDKPVQIPGHKEEENKKRTIKSGIISYPEPMFLYLDSIAGHAGIPPIQRKKQTVLVKQ